MDFSDAILSTSELRRDRQFYRLTSTKFPATYAHHLSRLQTEYLRKRLRKLPLPTSDVFLPSPCKKGEEFLLLVLGKNFWTPWDEISAGDLKIGAELRSLCGDEALKARTRHLLDRLVLSNDEDGIREEKQISVLEMEEERYHILHCFDGHLYPIDDLAVSLATEQTFPDENFFDFIPLSPNAPKFPKDLVGTKLLNAVLDVHNYELIECSDYLEDVQDNVAILGKDLHRSPKPIEKLHDVLSFHGSHVIFEEFQDLRTNLKNLLLPDSIDLYVQIMLDDIIEMTVKFKMCQDITKEAAIGKVYDVPEVTSDFVGADIPVSVRTDSPKTTPEPPRHFSTGRGYELLKDRFFETAGTGDLYYHTVTTFTPSKISLTGCSQAISSSRLVHSQKSGEPGIPTNKLSTSTSRPKLLAPVIGETSEYFSQGLPESSSNSANFQLTGTESNLETSVGSCRKKSNVVDVTAATTNLSNNSKIIRRKISKKLVVLPPMPF